MFTAETSASRHAVSVLDTLSGFLDALPEPVLTPFGVSLTPVSGRFAEGHAVLIPGIDDCTPRRAGVVLCTGLRKGWSGAWCLVRESAYPHAMSLVRQEDLMEAPGAALIRQRAPTTDIRSVRMAGCAAS